MLPFVCYKSFVMRRWACQTVKTFNRVRMSSASVNMATVRWPYYEHMLHLLPWWYVDDSSWYVKTNQPGCGLARPDVGNTYLVLVREEMSSAAWLYKQSSPTKLFVKERRTLRQIWEVAKRPDGMGDDITDPSLLSFQVFFFTETHNLLTHTNLTPCSHLNDMML